MLFTWGHAILRVGRDGVVSVFAGDVASFGSGDGPAQQARFYRPSGLAADGAGNIFVADTGNHTVRRITPSGEVSTVLGTAGKPGVVLGSAPGGLMSPTRLLLTPNGLLVGSTFGVVRASP